MAIDDPCKRALLLSTLEESLRDLPFLRSDLRAMSVCLSPLQVRFYSGAIDDLESSMQALRRDLRGAAARSRGVPRDTKRARPS